MNQHKMYGKLLIGIIFIFIISLVFTRSVKGQDLPVSVTPLTTVSSFDDPKDPEAPADDNNTLNTIPNASSGTDTDSEYDIPVPFPEADISFDKTCTPTDLTLDELLTCTVTIQNNGAEDITYKILDLTSPNFTVVEDSVVGGRLHNHNIITNYGTLTGGTTQGIAVEKADTLLAYNSLGELGIPPLTDIGDESMVNLSTLQPYIYNGEEYTTVGMSSNGYLIAGLGSDEDIAYIPQIFPDEAIPNNVIAPLWTDLDPSEGGNLYAALLTRDNISWVVFEWENVPVFDSEKPDPNCGGGGCNPDTFTFQIWIKTNAPEQDITFVYEKVEGVGAESGLNIGAENVEGTIGGNYEALPIAGDELVVLSTPGTAGETHVISYTADPVLTGEWIGCAVMKIFDVRGLAFDCELGIINE
jgi:hypothetical protein